MQYFLTFHRRFEERHLLRLPVLAPRSQVKKIKFSYGERFCERLEASICQTFLEALEDAVLVKLWDWVGNILWTGIIDQRPAMIGGDSTIRASGLWYLAVKQDFTFFSPSQSNLPAGTILNTCLQKHAEGGGYANGENLHGIKYSYARVSGLVSGMGTNLDSIDFQHWKVSRLVEEVEKVIAKESISIGVDPDGYWSVKGHGSRKFYFDLRSEFDFKEFFLDHRGILNTFISTAQLDDGEQDPVSYSRSSDLSSYSRFFTRTEVQNATDISSYSRLESHSLALKSSKLQEEPKVSFPQLKLRVLEGFLTSKKGIRHDDLIQGKDILILGTPYGYSFEVRVSKVEYEILGSGCMVALVSAEPVRTTLKEVVEYIGEQASRSGKVQVMRKGE